MSDTFDHELDAFESMIFDDRPSYGSSFQRDPLYYHRSYKITLVAETEKAYLFKFNDNSESWVAKRFCKKLTKDSVYIWHKASFLPAVKEG